MHLEQDADHSGWRGANGATLTIPLPPVLHFRLSVVAMASDYRKAGETKDRELPKHAFLRLGLWREEQPSTLWSNLSFDPTTHLQAMEGRVANTLWLNLLFNPIPIRDPDSVIFVYQVISCKQTLTE